ncbi:hypothetical protein NC653_028105 [Populus alba x Populus x berolinensis]|uniref:Uncharacterized protein n=1 Tax=Populus alba x Populus x berolinensis TaxID=444605 RepID=A0AAD6Q5V5_9ROSI|nr:hypothetical protein NC653_028105 [Populus alba x Populus x berolinensis]
MFITCFGRSSDDDNYDDSVSKMKAAEEALEAQKKQSSFELSGKLAAETNRVIGITLLFTKPPYAKKPDIRWRLYVFKGGEALNVYPLGDVYVSHKHIGKQNPLYTLSKLLPFWGISVISCFWFVWQVEKEQHEGMLKNQVRIIPLNLSAIMNYLKRIQSNLVIAGRPPIKMQLLFVIV